MEWELNNWQSSRNSYISKEKVEYLNQMPQLLYVLVIWLLFQCNGWSRIPIYGTSGIGSTKWYTHFCRRLYCIYQGNWVHDINGAMQLCMSNPNRMVPQLCNSRHFIQFPMEPIFKICRPQYFCVEALSAGITCTPVRFFFSLHAWPCMHTPI